jgi:hypothetical protein
MTTKLVGDLLDLPAQVSRGDFVLNLAAGVTQSNVSGTLHSYVVTKQLTACFDQSLGFIRGAIDSASSKACYLHGSFGSGKSHFMAVLHQLLQGNPEARGIKELAAVVAKHNDWTQGRKFLLVPFHMIGSRTMEQGILGQYANYVRQLHPDAPIPGVFLAESLFEDAKSLRIDMGDASFFPRLNQNKNAGGGGWGSISAGWDASSFDTALVAPPGDKERTRLVGDLIGAFFRSYHNVAAGQDEAYLDLDKGLAVISQHAQALGYDALILFLDELILWLASHAADLSFIHHETQKLVKLVEAQNVNRPIPLISFVARQRDLRKLIGDTVPGAQKLNFDDSVDWSEGRFGVIKLEDRNLPLIANKRVLKPKSAAAKQELDASFEQTAKIRKEVMDTLLTDEYGRDMFRLIYPFSPALMETLVAASSMLQRERTALKVMVQLLVEQRDTLKLGDIVPVGDLYDAVAQGDEAFSQDMKVHFDNARKLYHEKLLPMLEAHHGARREELLAKPLSDQSRINFVNDDRLVKTLLLAALVPGVPSLRSLNASRLAALNHGTVRSPIPGKEAGLVLQKVKDWSSQVGEIKVERDSPNPTISIQLSGVDTEAIIAAAEHEDNLGNQMRMVRQILFQELEIDNIDQMFLTYEFPWRNTARECDLIYSNVRSLPDTSLTANGTTWKVVVDYPFDEPGHTSRDDLGKLQIYGANNPSTRTLVWLPAYFSETARRDLSRLVIIEHILAGERFTGYAAFLSPQDRQTARTLLENQRSALQERVKQHIEAAYGIRGSQSKAIDDSHTLADTYKTLYSGLDLQPPAASSLKGALEELLGQALAFEFPAHPSFGAEIKSLHLRKVYEEVLKAVSEKGGRVLVEKNVRSLLKQIAEPLNLGEQGETHFVLGQRWKDHFTRKAAESGNAITVQALRRWINEPRSMGLPQECENLIILVFAAQTNRSFFLHNAPTDVTLAKLPDDAELREQQLPPEASWVVAIERAGRILGATSSPLLNASNVAKLADDIQNKMKSGVDHCGTLVEDVAGHLADFAVPTSQAPRHQTAEAVASLLESIRDAKPAIVIQTLANLTPVTSEAAMGSSFSSVKSVVDAMAATQWKLFDSLRQIHDERATAAQALLQRVSDALKSDQHVTDLGPVLRIEQSKAIDLLTASPPPPLPPPDRKPPIKPPVKTEKVVVDSGTRENLSLSEADEIIAQLRKKTASNQVARVNVSWVIEE